MRGFKRAVRAYIEPALPNTWEAYRRWCIRNGGDPYVIEWLFKYLNRK